jgi:hypothetical protein
MNKANKIYIDRRDHKIHLDIYKLVNNNLSKRIKAFKEGGPRGRYVNFVKFDRPVDMKKGKDLNKLLRQWKMRNSIHPGLGLRAQIDYMNIQPYQKFTQKMLDDYLDRLI